MQKPLSKPSKGKRTIIKFANLSAFGSLPTDSCEPIESWWPALGMPVPGRSPHAARRRHFVCDCTLYAPDGILSNSAVCVIDFD